jgi:hypothetical protein
MLDAMDLIGYWPWVRRTVWRFIQKHRAKYPVERGARHKADASRRLTGLH